MPTRNIVPRADNEGQIGTASKRWAKVYAVIVEGYEAIVNKDASGGYAGKTLEKINIYNAARTYLNQIAAAATTAVRTWTFPDKDITVAGVDDISTHAELDTGIHSVGASTIESIAGSQSKVDTHAVLTMDTHGIASYNDTELSGTPKVIQMTIGGVPYYFKAYPTKV